MLLTSRDSGAQHTCDDEAALLVNGVPMCAEHENEWVAQGLVEDRERLPEPTPAVAAVVERSGEVKSKRVAAGKGER